MQKYVVLFCLIIYTSLSSTAQVTGKHQSRRFGHSRNKTRDFEWFDFTTEPMQNIVSTEMPTSPDHERFKIVRLVLENLSLELEKLKRFFPIEDSGCKLPFKVERVISIVENRSDEALDAINQILNNASVVSSSSPSIPLHSNEFKPSIPSHYSVLTQELDDDIQAYSINMNYTTIKPENKSGNFLSFTTEYYVLDNSAEDDNNETYETSSEIKSPEYDNDMTNNDEHENHHHIDANKYLATVQADDDETESFLWLSQATDATELETHDDLVTDVQEVHNSDTTINSMDGMVDKSIVSENKTIHLINETSNENLTNNMSFVEAEYDIEEDHETHNKTTFSEPSTISDSKLFTTNSITLDSPQTIQSDLSRPTTSLFLTDIVKPSVQTSTEALYDNSSDVESSSGYSANSNDIYETTTMRRKVHNKQHYRKPHLRNRKIFEALMQRINEVKKQRNRLHSTLPNDQSNILGRNQYLEDMSSTQSSDYGNTNNTTEESSRRRGMSTLKNEPEKLTEEGDATLPTRTVDEHHKFTSEEPKAVTSEDDDNVTDILSMTNQPSEVTTKPCDDEGDNDIGGEDDDDDDDNDINDDDDDNDINDNDDDNDVGEYEVIVKKREKTMDKLRRDIYSVQSNISNIIELLKDYSVDAATVRKASELAKNISVLFFEMKSLVKHVRTGKTRSKRSVESTMADSSHQTDSNFQTIEVECVEGMSITPKDLMLLRKKIQELAANPFNVTVIRESLCFLVSVKRDLAKFKESFNETSSETWQESFQTLTDITAKDLPHLTHILESAQLEGKKAFVRLHNDLRSLYRKRRHLFPSFS